MEHASTTVRILLPLLSFVILATIFVARKKHLFIRRIQGLTAIDEAVGRATEMGRPILCNPGLGGIDVPTLQALAIFSYITRVAARFSNRVILSIADSSLYPIAEEVMEDAYVQEGRGEQFSSEDVRFLSDKQFAFAASVAGLIWRERVAACFYFGLFFAEALIFSETGQQAGAIQVAGTPSTTQIPFFIASCDYVIIGDEFYAASAYLSREPTLLGSIVGQDIAKGILLAIVLAGSILVTLAEAIGSPLGQTFIKLFK